MIHQGRFNTKNIHSVIDDDCLRIYNVRECVSTIPINHNSCSTIAYDILPLLSQNKNDDFHVLYVLDGKYTFLCTNRRKLNEICIKFTKNEEIITGIEAIQNIGFVVLTNYNYFFIPIFSLDHKNIDVILLESKHNMGIGYFKEKLSSLITFSLNYNEKNLNLQDNQGKNSVCVVNYEMKNKCKVIVTKFSELEYWSLSSNGIVQYESTISLVTPIRHLAGKIGLYYDHFLIEKVSSGTQDVKIIFTFIQKNSYGPTFLGSIDHINLMENKIFSFEYAFEVRERNARIYFDFFDNITLIFAENFLDIYQDNQILLSYDKRDFLDNAIDIEYQFGKLNIITKSDDIYCLNAPKSNFYANFLSNITLNDLEIGLNGFNESIFNFSSLLRSQTMYTIFQLHSLQDLSYSIDKYLLPSLSPENFNSKDDINYFHKLSQFSLKILIFMKLINRLGGSKNDPSLIQSLLLPIIKSLIILNSISDEDHLSILKETTVVGSISKIFNCNQKGDIQKSISLIQTSSSLLDDMYEISLYLQPIIPANFQLCLSADQLKSCFELIINNIYFLMTDGLSINLFASSIYPLCMKIMSILKLFIKNNLSVNENCKNLIKLMLLDLKFESISEICLELGFLDILVEFYIKANRLDDIRQLVKNFPSDELYKIVISMFYSSNKISNLISSSILNDEIMQKSTENYPELCAYYTAKLGDYRAAFLMKVKYIQHVKETKTPKELKLLIGLAKSCFMCLDHSSIDYEIENSWNEVCAIKV